MSAKFHLTITIAIILLSGCNNVHENKLKYEKSPYLLQHKNNPVWWKTWNQEAFQLAKKENKIIFLSIGYSTCHWCHVMEKESFEDHEVAKILNDHFVAIKIDREERPDVDKIYMNSLNMMGQRGGWPLSMFLTPDLIPIFGGTYFPKNNFTTMLNKLNEVWGKNKEKIVKNGQRLFETLKKSSSENTVFIKEIRDNILQNSVKKLSQNFDQIDGGFGRAPKFPPTMSLQFLLRVAKRSSNQKTVKETMEIVDKTLTQMYRGGIYDHVGGGFHRYSTDKRWHTPHFEKMLYGNALLSTTYLETYLLTKDKFFLSVAEDTLNYILRDMQGPDGGFFSAEDADSDGEEGKFYVWKKRELKKTLTTEEFKYFTSIYPLLSRSTNENHSFIINLLDSSQYKNGFDPKVAAIKEKLLKKRELRNRPLRDEKFISGWNGLMISSMIKGYIATGHKKYLYAATNATNFIVDNLKKGDQFFRRFKDGEAKYAATLDDYAYFIQSLIDFYQITFDKKWLELAIHLQETQIKKLWSENHKAFFYAPENKDLIIRSVDLSDNARPNSNAISCLNMLKLYALTYQKNFKDLSLKIIQNHLYKLKNYPRSYTQLLIAIDFFLDHSKEIAIVGKELDGETNSFIKLYLNQFLPNAVISYKNKNNSNPIPLLKDKVILENKTTAYVCEDQICLLPTTNVKKFNEQINQIKSLKF